MIAFLYLLNYLYCKISGIIGWEANRNKKIDVLRVMQNTLQKRGPDQSGIYTSPKADLAHTRLSVVDIENGKQPMECSVFQKEKYILVYNGELYNTEELREQLKSLGHIFQSHSDTEVLLNAYIQWKESCVDYLNGIFAFAVWEEHTQKLFFARDRIGVKPFFYSVVNDIFLFASEIKTIIANPLSRHKIDTESIAEILLIGPGRTPGYGVFKGIHELKPGHYGFYQNNKLTIKKYWQLEDQLHTDSFEDTKEKVKHLVLDAIKRQTVSDVPVGCFLSGGLDSSIISAIASQHIKNLHTFSVEYQDNEKFFKSDVFQPDRDISYIDEMVNFIKSEHHQIILDTEDLAKALYAATDARDLPGMADIDSSLLLFCKEVKKHVTVALSGECADEIFGGYPWYRDQDVLHHHGFPWSKSEDYRKRFLKNEILNEIPKDYVQKKYEKSLQTAHILATNHLEYRMKQMVNLNFDWFMQTLLDRKDRMSMYNGLEVRVPFCDYRIAEYLYSVPWEIKDYKGREKGLLREAMKDILPDNVLWRKKSPYPKTHNPAYLNMVSHMLKEVIEDNDAPILNFLKKEYLEELIGTEKNEQWYGQLMNRPQTIAYFIQFNYWLDKYL